jgi:hypothetical protein
VSRTTIFAAASVLVLAAVLPVRADLSNARAEPNLERRARLALDNAAGQFLLASDAYKAGDWQKTFVALEELRESVDLAYASLKQTGKSPRNSGHFKNLEVKTRGLLKNLEGLRQRLAFGEREQLAPLAEHLQQVHDEVLQSILSPPKRKDD